MIELIKKQALNDNIPIVMDESLKFITDYIKLNNVKSILEIGTAIGYSAISFAMIGPNVDTIERNTELYNQAVINVNKTNLNSKVKLIYADALKYDKLNNIYDLIFIDGAKAQYTNFFNKYEKHLNKNGVIICDNLNFHNLDIKKVSRSTRQLITKINKFKVFLKENDQFETKFYEIGDGMSVSKRR